MPIISKIQSILYHLNSTFPSYTVLKLQIDASHLYLFLGSWTLE